LPVLHAEKSTQKTKINKKKSRQIGRLGLECIMLESAFGPASLDGKKSVKKIGLAVGEPPKFLKVKISLQFMAVRQPPRPVVWSDSYI